MQITEQHCIVLGRQSTARLLCCSLQLAIMHINHDQYKLEYSTVAIAVYRSAVLVVVLLFLLISLRDAVLGKLRQR